MAALIGRVVQPSGISLRASGRPLESEVIVSGSRLTGELDRRLGGDVVDRPTRGTVDVVPIGFTVVVGFVVATVGFDVVVGFGLVAFGGVVVGFGVAVAVDPVVVDVSRLRNGEVAGAATLGVITAADIAAPSVPMTTPITTDRRGRSFRQAMTIPGSSSSRRMDRSVQPKDLIGGSKGNLSTPLQLCGPGRTRLRETVRAFVVTYRHEYDPLADQVDESVVTLPDAVLGRAHPEFAGHARVRPATGS